MIITNSVIFERSAAYFLLSAKVMAAGSVKQNHPPVFNRSDQDGYPPHLIFNRNDASGWNLALFSRPSWVFLKSDVISGIILPDFLNVLRRVLGTSASE